MSMSMVLGIAGNVIENVMRSHSQDRAASQAASLSHSHRTQSFNLPTERLSSLRQEQQAAPMLANMHNNMMRAERFENNRNTGRIFASSKA